MRKIINAIFTIILITMGFLSGCIRISDDSTQFSIEFFDVKPSVVKQGEYANLSWCVTAATSVAIDNGIGNVTSSGYKIINPSHTTIYILTTSNATNTKTATVTLIVNYESNESNETYSSDTGAIVSSVDEIVPYEQTSALDITATALSNLTNITLWYRYRASVEKSLENKDYISELDFADVLKPGIRTINYPNGVVSVDGLTAVVSYLSDTLTLVDCSDSNDIQFISCVNNTIGNIIGHLDGVHDVEMTMDRNWVYTIQHTTSGYVVAWDISDPAHPSPKANASIGQGMYLWLSDDDNYLYATTGINVTIFNVTNKASHQLEKLSVMRSRPFEQFWHPTVYGDALYLGGEDENYTEHGIVVYNISDKSNPRCVNNLSTNRSVWDPIVMEYDGFVYLLFDGGVNQGAFCDGYITCYNISANNETHPTWMFQTKKVGFNHNDSMGVGIAAVDGYIFSQKNNPVYDEYNTGIQVYNWTDTSQPPVFLTRIFGKDAPNWLNDSHVIQIDKNGSGRSIYSVQCDGDCLTVLDLNWLIDESSGFGGWVKYGMDISPPWSWSFSFSNGTGVYEFYSIGKKTGSLDELAPSEEDTVCHYIQVS